MTDVEILDQAAVILRSQGEDVLSLKVNQVAARIAKTNKAAEAVIARMEHS